MTSRFTREQLKLSVAKMCLTIGWHTTMTTPIELLTDILCNYLSQLGKLTNDYANGFGLSEASVEHLALALKDFHVGLTDLEDFVRNVDCPEPPSDVPQYPVAKEDHLNFLKPGSKEVVTRQVHIHEHLPPMFPHLEEEATVEESIKTESSEEAEPVENIAFKHPAEISQDTFKHPRILNDEESGRPTRELSSVMMTTSGFLSPAREGRLPEARTPAIALEAWVPMLPPEQHETLKKPLKTMKKCDKPKDTNGRELCKPHKDSPSHKHAFNLKNLVRNKMKHRGHTNLGAKNYMIVNESKNLLSPHKKSHSENDNHFKFNKTLAAARMKTEKFNTTITPIPARVIPATIVRPEPLVDKLFTEPDKRKIDILRKISVKPDKIDKSRKIKGKIKVESRGNSPDLIIDESINATPFSHHNMPKDITIELVSPVPPTNVSSGKSPEKNDKFEKFYFDDYSPPGTPSTPRTPEMISRSPPLSKGEKQKKNSKHKKLHKYSSPSGIDMDVTDVELERPKTPDSNIIEKPEKHKHPGVPPMHFPFFAPFSGPGLIPTPLTNSLFPHLAIPPLGLSTFGQPPYIPSLHPPMSMNFMSPAHAPVPASVSTLAHATSSAPVTPLTPPLAHFPSPALTTTTASISRKEDECDQQPCFTSLTSVDEDAPSPVELVDIDKPSTSGIDKKNKEHKKDKRDKLKKKNKKDKHKSDKRKFKEEKKEKSRIKKEKKEKKKNKQSQDGSASPVPKLTLKLPPKTKLNIKAIVKRVEKIEPQPCSSEAPEHISQREASPELARFAALVTGQPKPKNHTAVSSTSTPIDIFPTSSTDSLNMKKSVIPKVGNREISVAPNYVVEPSASCYIDSEGKKVWICPGCGVQDDGSPMIGCDDCDAWYHWVCVGIQVPPDDNEDWYCRHCIGRNRDLLKRAKRKKRKSHDKKSGKH